ncbi:MAG: HNH endonuclease [Cyclobacteriaceae bacterium]
MLKEYNLKKKERDVIFKKTEGHCHVCGCVIDGKWAADHVVPHAVGGKCNVDNFLPCCNECNRFRWFYKPEELKKILRLGVYCNKEIKKGTTLEKKLKICLIKD